MIIGIGTDIIDITRIERVINRFGDRFKNRVFTKKEILKCEARKLAQILMPRDMLQKRHVPKLSVQDLERVYIGEILKL